MIIEKVNDYSYNVKNIESGKVTMFHVTHLKMDLNDLSYLEREVNSMKERELKGQTDVEPDNDVHDNVNHDDDDDNESLKNELKTDKQTPHSCTSGNVSPAKKRHSSAKEI